VLSLAIVILTFHKVRLLAATLISGDFAFLMRFFKSSIDIVGKAKTEKRVFSPSRRHQIRYVPSDNVPSDISVSWKKRVKERIIR
jgi:hypothetical protein